MASRRVTSGAARSLLRAGSAQPVIRTTASALIHAPAATSSTSAAPSRLLPVAQARCYSRRPPNPSLVRLQRELEAQRVHDEENKVWSFEEVKRQVEINNGLSDEPKVKIIDVREPEELLETGCIPGAINIPITTAVQSFHIPDDDFIDLYGFMRPTKEIPLLFYCKAGVRAKTAAGLARHAGWQETGEYTGSWNEWSVRGGPVERLPKPRDPYREEHKFDKF